MNEETDITARLAAFRTLHHIVARLNSAFALNETLQAIADGVLATTGFGIVLVNMVRPDGDIVGAAAAGSDELRETLVGMIGRRSEYDAFLATGTPMGNGGLIHIRADPDSPAFDLPDYIPEPLLDEQTPGAWTRWDNLVAPLRAPSGEVVGFLAVDSPVGGMWPVPWRFEVLEMFAQQAAIAIVNAREREDAHRAVEALRRDQQELRASEESFRRAFHNAPSGMAMVSSRPDDRGRLLRVNGVLCRLTGRESEELLSVGLKSAIHPEDLATYEQIYEFAMDGAAEELETEPCELRLLGADERHVWVSLRMSAVHDRRWQPQFVLVHVEDIGERKRREQELTRAARTDALTGLPNVTEMRDRIADALRSGRSVGVLFGDFDRFKLINDSYGHLVGDEVLVELGRRLRLGVRAGDVVARIGGDEFVVLVTDRAVSEVAELADRLTRLASRPIRVGAVEVVISVSFGYAHRDATPDPPVDHDAIAIEATRLLRAADSAMYRLKHAHRLRNLGGA